MRICRDFRFLDFARGRRLSFEGGGGDFAKVGIPHDFNADAPFSDGGRRPEQQGYIRSRGDGTYRGVFDADGENAVFYLLADGIYRDCEIYVNGRDAGASPYGYIPMTMDISELILPGENLLEIYVNNLNEREDRWYSGAGIYRRLSLLSVPEAHFIPDGVTVQTPEITEDFARLRIFAETAGSDEGRSVFAEVFGPSGPVASGWAERGDGGYACELLIEAPELWSPESPVLYRAELGLREGGAEIDRIGQTFGVRTAVFDAEKGFFLNGERKYLCGVNLHHDSGSLGAAFYPAVWRERLETLKSFGMNAVRTSHNPQARIFYELCDELGILVVDELYDKWDEGSYDAHFRDRYKQDVRAWIRRDKNHPCVIMYSVGNEVAIQGYPELFDPLDKLIASVREQDPTRPVSFGMHPFGWPEEIAAKTSREKALITAEIAKHVDVLLCNYQEHWYDHYHRAAPEACIIGSELYHWYTGEDGSPEYIEKHPWEYIRERPYVLGGFYWAGIDYRGESIGPESRGWTSSLLDITGRPKPRSHLAGAYWRDSPVIAAAAAVREDGLPPGFERKGWSFPPCVPHLNMLPENGPATILVFTNCEEVSFWQDGRRLEAKPVRRAGRCMFFELCPEPGRGISVVGENGGKEASRFRLPCFGPAAAVEISTSKNRLDSQDPEDIAVVRLRLADESGETCAQSGDEFLVSLSGLALLGMDNGDMGQGSSYPAKPFSFHNGCAVLFVRGEGPGTGKITVRCGSLGGSAKIEVG